MNQTHAQTWRRRIVVSLAAVLATAALSTPARAQDTISKEDAAAVKAERPSGVAEHRWEQHQQRPIQVVERFAQSEKEDPPHRGLDLLDGSHRVLQSDDGAKQPEDQGDAA